MFKRNSVSKLYAAWIFLQHWGDFTSTGVWWGKKEALRISITNSCIQSFKYLMRGIYRDQIEACTHTAGDAWGHPEWAFHQGLGPISWGSAKCAKTRTRTVLHYSTESETHSEEEHKAQIFLREREVLHGLWYSRIFDLKAMQSELNSR